MRAVFTALAALALASAAAAQASCRPSTFGPTCGPRLKAKVQQNARFNVVKFDVTRAFANSPGVLVFGARQARIRIPGSRCLLLVRPLVYVAFNADGNGRATRTISVPRDVRGTTLVQAGSIDTRRLRIGTSNGVRLACR